MADALALRGFSRAAFANSNLVTNHTVDASNEGAAWVFQARNAAAISKGWFRYGARTGTPPTYRLSLQSLTTAGVPDGTVLGGGSPASATFTPPADTTWDALGQWVTLDNAYTPTKGQVIALVVEYSSGTIDGSNNSSFCRSVSNLHAQTVLFPYSVTNAAGSWSKATGNACACFAVEDTGGVYGFPFVSQYTTTVSTSGQRQAAAFTLPTTFGQSFVLRGVSIALTRAGSAGGTCEIGVWNAAGTLLASTGSFDSDHIANPNSEGVIDAFFTSAVTLDHGTTYYAGIESSGTGVGLLGINLTNAADRGAYPLATSRTFSEWNGSAWSDTTTRIPCVDLIFEDITVPSGSGGTVFTGAAGISQSGIGAF